MTLPIRVLFVCMGNICRSPLAEGTFRARVEAEGLSDVIETDSAGTHAYHVGEPADLRARNCARRRGLDIEDLRARLATAQDFHDFHYVLAMDSENYDRLAQLCPTGQEDRLKLYLKEYAPETVVESDVPDPYWSGDDGFDHVFDLVDAAAQGLLAEIRARHLTPSV